MRKYYARFDDVMEDISGEEVDEFYHKMSQVYKEVEDNSDEELDKFSDETISEDDETEDSSVEEVNKSVESLGESIAAKVTISWSHIILLHMTTSTTFLY